jgi:hypothetical protein
MTSWQASLKVGQDRKTLLEGLKVIEDYANKVSDSAKYYSGPNTNPIVGYLPGSGVVTQDQLRQLKDKYPNIDMDALLTKMGLNYYGK